MIKKIINYIRHQVRIPLTKREKRGHYFTEDRKNYNVLSEVTKNAVRRKEPVLVIEK